MPNQIDNKQIVSFLSFLNQFSGNENPKCSKTVINDVSIFADLISFTKKRITVTQLIKLVSKSVNLQN